jgi:murein DD-endopeptidase MepM/ murein hydrolase activator NlpD
MRKPWLGWIIIGFCLLAACRASIEPITDPIHDEYAEESVTGYEMPDSEPEGSPAEPEGVSLEPIQSNRILSLPQAVVEPVSAWRPPPYDAPWAILPNDHFYFHRPIPSGDVNWPNPNYRYGSTSFGTESIHTGIDLSASRGTTVLAAGTGEVIWVGYGLYRGIYDETDPYGLAIAIQHDFGYEGETLFTIYGHLEAILVWPGQRVSAGDVIGMVGSTGHATGPHLHFEVRLGENRYFGSRNPELWIVPAEGWGVLAGQILDSNGRPTPEHLVLIRSLETGQEWKVWTYALGTVHSDDAYQENFVISDLPAGPYEVQVDFVGLSFTTQLFVKPGQTNLIKFHGRDGFISLPDPPAPNLEQPPNS